MLVPGPRRGVFRGQKASEARAGRPALALVPQRPSLYVEMHEAMVAAVDALAPVEHVLSVDELALRVPRGEPPEAFVERVGEAVPRALGEAVQVSVGAGPS